MRVNSNLLLKMLMAFLTVALKIRMKTRTQQLKDFRAFLDKLSRVPTPLHNLKAQGSQLNKQLR